MADTLEPPFRLITLGRLALVDAQGHEDAALGSRRRKLALLAVLALSRRPLTRDTLVNMFWGERAEERARNSLSDALSNLRRVLGRAALPAYRDEIGITEDTPLTVDVLELEAALAAGRPEQAVALYGGPFLEGVHIDDALDFEDWRDRIRRRVDAAFARSAAAVCEALARDGPAEARVQLARRWLAVEPTSAEAALHLLNGLGAAGTYAAHAAAVREYRLLEERLRRDVGVAPAAAVGARAAELARRLEDSSAGELQQTNVLDARQQDLAPPAPVDPATPSPTQRRQRVAAAAAAGVLLVVLLLLLVVERDVSREARPVGAVPSASIRSVAVLRFRNIGGDSADQYFSDGMAEEIMHTLARVEGVQVAARSASFALSADSIDVRDIARRLNVATVLEGSVRRSGDMLRVAVRLVNASEGYTVWQETYDRGVAEAFAVQEEVAQSVAAALQIQLQREDAVRARRARTDFETYDLYLRGRYVWWTAHTEQGVRSSISYFRRALARDSSFAPAWVGLADAFLELTASHDVAPADVVPHAREALLRATRLDPHLADAHASLGYVATFHDRRWTYAEAAFTQALELDARHANARLWYAWLLTARGRHEEALAQIRQAQTYDPLSRLLGARLATMLYFARDYEGAVQQAHASIEADSSFWLPHRQSGEALVQLGRNAEAVAALRRAASISASGETRARLAYGLARAGAESAARRLLADLMSSTESGYLSPVELARVHVGLGDHPHAIQLLERAVELGAPAAILLNVEPAFDPLRTDPRFLAVVRTLGL